MTSWLACDVIIQRRLYDVMIVKRRTRLDELYILLYKQWHRDRKVEWQRHLSTTSSIIYLWCELRSHTSYIGRPVSFKAIGGEGGWWIDRRGVHTCAYLTRIELNTEVGIGRRRLIASQPGLPDFHPPGAHIRSTESGTLPRKDLRYKALSSTSLLWTRPGRASRPLLGHRRVSHPSPAPERPPCAVNGGLQARESCLVSVVSSCSADFETKSSLVVNWVSGFQPTDLSRVPTDSAAVWTAVPTRRLAPARTGFVASVWSCAKEGDISHRKKAPSLRCCANRK